jgi:hypothetical protein
MSKRRWLRVILLIVFAGSAPWWTPRAFWMAYGWRHHEPFYRGWPASYWKRELRDPDLHTGIAMLDGWLKQRLPPRSRDGAIAEIARGGRRAVPVLIAALEDEDTREGAAQVILLMPPRQAQPAVPALIRAARQAPASQVSPSAEAAVKALLRVGGRATAFAFAAALDDPDESVRLGALDVLAELGPDAKDASPFLDEWWKMHPMSGAERRAFLRLIGPDFYRRMGTGDLCAWYRWDRNLSNSNHRNLPAPARTNVLEGWPPWLRPNAPDSE